MYFEVSKKISSFPFLLVKYYLINSPDKIPHRAYDASYNKFQNTFSHRQ